MNDFEFYNPVKVIFGAGKTDEIGVAAKPYGTKALVVSYREHGFMTDLLARVLTRLQEAGMKSVPFYEIVANPMLSDVERGIAVAKEQGVDLVIAVGGGSVMDSAKTIAAGVCYGGNPWDMFNSRHDGEVHAQMPTAALPLLMIPTLPATSSEMNCGAVITRDETAEKSYVFAECIYPKVSILDPELLLSLPAYQSACGTADAISHVLEIYLNSEVNNPVQFRMMEGIAKAIYEIGPQVMNDPQNIALRGIQQWACCVSWNGWIMPGMDGFFPMHALGHSLSAFYDTAHGQTLAIMMPAFMRYIAQTAPGRLIQFAENIMSFSPDSGSEYERALQAVAHFESWLNQLGLKTHLSELAIDASDLPKIQENAMRVFADAEGMINAIKPVSKDGAMDILQAAY